MHDDTKSRTSLAACCCSCEHLTSREVSVLREAAAGCSNAQIATTLHLSVHTVARHMTSMLHKADERSRTALVSRAYRVGILTVGTDGPHPTGRRCLPA